MEPGEAPPSPRRAAHPEPRTAFREPVTENPAAEQEVQVTPGRPALPRRRRQSHLAPQLANQPPPQQQSQGVRRQRSSDQVRDLYSAMESGTRQARLRQQYQNHQDGHDGRKGHR